MSEIYFSYKTITNVTYERGNQIELPGITICYNRLGQLKMEFKKDYSVHNMSDEINRQVRLNKLNSVSKQFEMLDNLPLILNICELTSGYSLLLNCSQISNFTRYLSGGHFCFTIFPQLNGEPDERFGVHESLYQWGYLVNLNLNRNVVKIGQEYDKVNLQLSSRKQVHYQHHTRGSIDFDLETKDYSHVKYRKIVIKRLITNSGNPCFVATTRQQCIEECVIKELKKRKKMYPVIFLSKDQDENTRFSKLEDLKYDVWMRGCIDGCQLKDDCYKEHYIIDGTEYAYHYSNKSRDLFYVMIEFPTHPTTVYEISLKMSFEEYLCLIASILSLWFGFSILAFSESFPKLFINYYKNFNNKFVMNVKNNNYRSRNFKSVYLKKQNRIHSINRFQFA